MLDLGLKAEQAFYLGRERPSTNLTKLEIATSPTGPRRSPPPAPNPSLPSRWRIRKNGSGVLTRITTQVVTVLAAHTSSLDVNSFFFASSCSCSFLFVLSACLLYFDKTSTSFSAFWEENQRTQANKLSDTNNYLVKKEWRMTFKPGAGRKRREGTELIFLPSLFCPSRSPPAQFLSVPRSAPLPVPISPRRRFSYRPIPVRPTICSWVSEEETIHAHVMTSSGVWQKFVISSRVHPYLQLVGLFLVAGRFSLQLFLCSLGLEQLILNILPKMKQYSARDQHLAACLALACVTTGINPSFYRG